MAESNHLVEKRAEYAAKSKKFADVSDLLATPEDYSKKEVLELLGAQDATDAKSKYLAANTEIEVLGRDLDQLTLEETKRVHEGRLRRLNEPIRQTIPGTSLTDDPRSFGELAIASKEFMADLKANRGGRGIWARTEIDVSPLGLKTLLQTSTALQPRTGIGTVIIEQAVRPVQVLDFIPTDTIDTFEYPYMRETTRTQAAAEVAEAGTYAEDAFAYTRTVGPVQKIGSQIPCTDEQLADVGPMRALMDTRLTFGLRAQLDKQILVGSGTPPAIKGVINYASIQTQPRGTDAQANAIFKALVKVRVTGRAVPDCVMLHGLDWQTIRLAQNANGDYQFGPPSSGSWSVGSMGGADTLWGLPVLQTEALTQGTGLVGAFKTYSQLMYRKGIEVQTGYIASQFIAGQLTIRADLRAAFVVYRDQAFATITGL